MIPSYMSRLGTLAPLFEHYDRAELATQSPSYGSKCPYICKLREFLGNFVDGELRASKLGGHEIVR